MPTQIKTSHVLGALIILYFFDKWIDRKVKSFIDYAMDRPSRSIEHFKPFESTMRVMDGRMYPDSPYMVNDALPSLAAPQSDQLTPLTMGGIFDNYMSIPRPSQKSQNTAFPPAKTFLPIADPAATEKQYSGMGWKNELAPANKAEIDHIAGNQTQLIELGPKYQAIAKQDGSQNFDQLMMNLDAEPNLSDRLQNAAMTFTR